jgi:hypothetical protein
MRAVLRTAHQEIECWRIFQNPERSEKFSGSGRKKALGGFLKSPHVLRSFDFSRLCRLALRTALSMKGLSVLFDSYGLVKLCNDITDNIGDDHFEKDIYDSFKRVVHGKAPCFLFLKNR